MREQKRGSRTQGIDFGEFDDAATASEYPWTCAELVERHGDCEVSHTNGNERIGDVLGGIEDTFESPREVRDAVVSTVGAAAVGRRRYSDRGGEPPEGRDERPVKSF